MRRQIGLPLAALAIAIAALASMPCRAEEVEEPRFEVYMGADSDGRTANVTTSLVWGAFGPVTQTGFRLKLDGLGDIDSTDAHLITAKLMGAELKSVSDLMAGYQFEYGPAWIKLYAGAAYGEQAAIGTTFNGIYHVETPQRKAWGAAAAFQSYWPMSDRVWASLNVTWLQPNSLTSIYSRGAYDIYRTEGGLRISAGAETSFSLTGEPTIKQGWAFEKYVQAGALLNLRYGRNDLSLSGGLSQPGGEAGSHLYAGISYGRQF